MTVESRTKHECCHHGGNSDHPMDRTYCCKCEFGVRKGPSLHGSGWNCQNCMEEHPGSKVLDGCPRAWHHIKRFYERVSGVMERGENK